jgi:hypothetical protein
MSDSHITVILYPESDDEIVVVGAPVDLDTYTFKGQLIGPTLKEIGVAVRLDMRLLLSSLQQMNLVEIVNGPTLEGKDEQSH